MDRKMIRESIFVSLFICFLWIDKQNCFIFSQGCQKSCALSWSFLKVSDRCQGVTYDVLRDIFPSISTPKLTLCKKITKIGTKKHFTTFCYHKQAISVNNKEFYEFKLLSVVLNLIKMSAIL